MADAYPAKAELMTSLVGTATWRFGGAIPGLVSSVVDWPAHADTMISVTVTPTKRTHCLIQGCLHFPHDMDCNQIYTNKCRRYSNHDELES